MGKPVTSIPKDAAWGYWECPACKEVSQDPDTFTVTCCPNGHVVRLGPVHHPTLADGYMCTKAWRSAKLEGEK
jgi:hypothetical protein